MNTSLTTSITPQFRMIDGVKIRYADSGGSAEPTLLLTSPWPESVYAFAPMWATLAERARLFASTYRGSAHPSAAMTSSLRERWAGSWPSSSSRPTSARRTLSRRTSGPRPPCLRRRRIPSGSRA